MSNICDYDNATALLILAKKPPLVLKGTTASSANQKARNQAEDDFEFILWSTYHVQVKSVGRRFNSEEVVSSCCRVFVLMKDTNFFHYSF